MKVSRSHDFFHRCCWRRYFLNVSGTTVCATASSEYVAWYLRNMQLVSERSSPNVHSRPKNRWCSQSSINSIKYSRRYALQQPGQQVTLPKTDSEALYILNAM